MDIAQDTLILAPGDPGWDDARQAWNLTVDQHPAAIALPASAGGVKEAIRFARKRGLQVAAQGPGHNPAPLGSLAGTVLVKTSMMRHASVDPEAKIARTEAGAVWGDVTDAATALPAAVGPVTSPVALRARTCDELARALTAAGYHASEGRPVLIEALFDASDVPPLLQDLTRVLAA